MKILSPRSAGNGWAWFFSRGAGGFLGGDHYHRQTDGNIEEKEVFNQVE